MVFRRLPQTPPDVDIPEPYWTEFLEIYKQFQELFKVIDDLQEAGSGGGVSGNHVIVPGPNGVTQHSSIPQGEIHVPHNWTVSSFSGLASLNVTNTDLYKIARVSTTNKYYTLTNTSPKTWVLWNGAGGTAPQIPTLSSSDVFTIYKNNQEYTVDLGRIITVDRLEITAADSPYQCEEINQIIEVDDTDGNVEIIFPENTRDDPLEVEVIKMVESNNEIKLLGNGRPLFPGDTICYLGTAARFRSSVNKWIRG